MNKATLDGAHIVKLGLLRLDRLGLAVEDLSLGSSAECARAVFCEETIAFSFLLLSSPNRRGTLPREASLSLHHTGRDI